MAALTKWLPGRLVRGSVEMLSWPLVAKGLLSHGECVSINHHACSMRVGDFKLIIRNYKPRFLHNVFLHPGKIIVVNEVDYVDESQMILLTPKKQITLSKDILFQNF
uniref:SFRICE_003996 n=1 Tax=Spodoptera frugiperda TaxID=7108 RepID=A0A2H1VAF9_SPOFR